MTITVGSAEDLIAAIPYSLGFQPRHSVVAVLTREHHLRMVARLDIAPGPHADAVLDAGWEQLSRQLPGCAADEAHLVLYDERPQGWPALLHIGDRLAQYGLQIPFAARVVDDQWWHYGCTEPECAAGWHQIPAPGDSPTVAEYVGRGRVVAPDRDTVVGRLEPDQEAIARVRLTAYQRNAPIVARKEWIALLGAGPTGDGYEPDPQTATRLARSLLDRNFRDALIAALAPDSFPGADHRPYAAGRVAEVLRQADCPQAVRDRFAIEFAALGPVDAWSPGSFRAVPPDAEVLDADARDAITHWQYVMLGRLSALARLVPPPLSANPYAVLAFLAGSLGEGLTMSAALDQALRADPQHRLALLLWTALQRGVYPFLVHQGSDGGPEQFSPVA